MENRLKAALLSIVLLLTTTGHTMPIYQFDKMKPNDRARYVAELIQSAEKILRDEGNPDVAAKVRHLFTPNAQEGLFSLGMGRFMQDLRMERDFDAKRVAQDPNARRLEVEDAMFLTFTANGIELAAHLLPRSKTFKPNGR